MIRLQAVLEWEQVFFRNLSSEASDEYPAKKGVLIRGIHAGRTPNTFGFSEWNGIGLRWTDHKKESGFNSLGLWNRFRSIELSETCCFANCLAFTVV